jgi:ribosomal RNA-processing protein 36
VSRKREILSGPEATKPKARDPRFDAAVGSLREDKFRRAYAFLDDYRESEMKDLRTALKKTKDPVQKEELQRALLRMESRKKAQDRKDREVALLEEHRAKEKELVSKGKKPFFLKKSEVKKKLLVEQFEGMKKRQVDKVIERRRKKIVAKERKELRMERRGASER